MRRKQKIVCGILVAAIAVVLAACPNGNDDPPRQLPAPTGLAIEDGVLTWNAVSGATGYRIYANIPNIGMTGAQDATSFSLLEDAYPPLEVGVQYQITVIAVGTGRRLNSLRSEATVFTDYLPEQLLTPTGLAVVDGVLTWDAVPGAAGYIVEANFDARGTTDSETDTSFDLFEDADPALVAESYIITVIAVHASDPSLNSPRSVPFTFVLDEGPPPVTGTLASFVTFDYTGLGVARPAWLDDVIAEGDALPRVNSFTGTAQDRLIRGRTDTFRLAWVENDNGLILRNVIDAAQPSVANQGVWFNIEQIPEDAELVLTGRASLGAAASGQISINHGGGGTPDAATADITAVYPVFDEFTLIATPAWLATSTVQGQGNTGIRLQANSAAQTAVVTMYIYSIAVGLPPQEPFTIGGIDHEITAEDIDGLVSGVSSTDPISRWGDNHFSLADGNLVMAGGGARAGNGGIVLNLEPLGLNVAENTYDVQIIGTLTGGQFRVNNPGAGTFAVVDAAAGDFDVSFTLSPANAGLLAIRLTNNAAGLGGSDTVITSITITQQTGGN